MKATIPFAYKGQALFALSGTPRDEVFVETMTVDVPEMSPGELEVALSFRSIMSDNDISIFLHGDVFLSDVAWHGGVKVDIDSMKSGHGGTPPKNLFDVLYKFRSPEHNAVESWYKSSKSERLGCDPERVREWVHSDREEAHAHACHVYQNLVAIDGFMWIPRAEPTIGVVGQNEPYMDMCLHDTGYRNRTRSSAGHPFTCPSFHISRVDDALALFADRYPGRPLNRSFEPDTIDVKIPEAFRFDKGQHTLDWVACDLFDVLCRDIQYVPDRRMAEWMELRKLVDAPKADGWDQKIAPLVEALIPLVRNSQHRKRIASLFDLWSDCEIDLSPGQLGARLTAR